MQAINIKSSKHCAICKYWYDPTNASINPKSPQINVWEFDAKAKRMCLQKGAAMSATANCGKFVCKLEII